MIRSVVIDRREPEWCRDLRLASVTPLIQELPAGDAWVMTDDAVLVIERKSLADLCASIADGRLLNQVIEMRRASEWCYVVVIGIPVIVSGRVVIGNRPTQWHWSSVQGALLTTQELGASVIWCENDAEYVATLEWLARRERGGVRVKVRRQAVMEAPSEALLSTLPGIGEGRAAALLKHCGTAAFALDYLTGDGGGEVPGIGVSTKQAARAALGLSDDLQLTVITKKENENE